jgi:hypothetical protein
MLVLQDLEDDHEDPDQHYLQAQQRGLEEERENRDDYVAALGEVVLGVVVWEELWIAAWQGIVEGADYLLEQGVALELDEQDEPGLEPFRKVLPVPNMHF